MEHVKTTNAIKQQQLEQQQRQKQQQQQPQQQHYNENQQQFCLRWHNHQTSLLSTLPVLLDQSHLTDVTISAEGRTLRAHRVVLSACSTFFMELFRALEATNHPVIIIPGASFGAIVSLLTFMYSGEVNVYEEQIPSLLNLAETLGIKGLADVQNNNLPKQAKTAMPLPPSPEKSTEFEPPHTPPTPTHTPTATTASTAAALSTPLLASKLGSCTPLENFFLKSLQFYPSLLPQPLNFSQTALNKTSELLAKYQLQYQQLYQDDLKSEDCYGAKRLKTISSSPQQVQQQLQQQQQQLQPAAKDSKRIDKIVESLRVSGGSSSCQKSSMESASNAATSPITLTPQALSQSFSSQLPAKSSPNYTATLGTSQLYTSKPALSCAFNANTPTAAQQAQAQAQHHGLTPYITPEDHAKLQQHIEQYAACQREAASVAAGVGSAMVSAKSEPNLLSLTEKLPANNAAPKPPSNSKLYATCFICHKQLSNQYNLRVHLETHQNVRYACNVCSHVSRSKDALRKHVSYRHPGAPSPCENEARRKRVNKLVAQSATSVATAQLTHTTTSGENSNGGNGSSDSQLPTLASNPYLFLPNQFQLAAAAAAAVAVAESNTTPALNLAAAAHEAPLSIIKSETPTAASNGEAGEATTPTAI